MTEPHWPADGSGDEFDGGRDDSAPGEAPQFPVPEPTALTREPSKPSADFTPSLGANLLITHCRHGLDLRLHARCYLCRPANAMTPLNADRHRSLIDADSDPTYHPGDYESPHTAPFVQVRVNGELVPGHIVYPWPDGLLVVEPLEA